MPSRHPGDEAVHGAAEIGYLTAREAEDFLGCVKELISMTVWLPLAGPQRQLVITHRGGQGMVRAYTSPERAQQLRTPDGPPGALLGRGFLELARDWKHADYGLVINPDSDSEFRMPRRVLPTVVDVWRRMQAERPEATPGEEAGISEAGDGGSTAGESVTPETAAAPGVAPIEPPAEIGGFKFAAMLDGFDENQRPFVSPERPRVTDAEEKRRILAYLNAGELLQSVTGFIPDMYEPSKGEVVPASTRTDGEWVWVDALAYYLEEYDIGPEPEFYRRIVAQDYHCPAVPRNRAQRAGRALEERQRIASRLYAEWREQNP